MFKPIVLKIRTLTMIELLLPPFITCLILTGIHAYLGIHVIERKVIFVDLSLAQIAALGTAVGSMFGLEYGETKSYFIALLFTLVGAAIFALTRSRQEKIPHEAIIGIVYAVSAAAFILIMDRAPEGAEEIKGMLIGSILFSSWNDVMKLATLYSIIGIFHFIFRKNFISISCHPQEAYEDGIRVRLWDFLFYISFGFVVTSSVSIAGVLLVFTFLIVPAVCAMFFSERFHIRLLIGCGVGIFASLLGMLASVIFDLPTGAAIVCAFGVTLIISACIQLVIKKIKPAL